MNICSRFTPIKVEGKVGGNLEETLLIELLSLIKKWVPKCSKKVAYTSIWVAFQNFVDNLLFSKLLLKTGIRPSGANLYKILQIGYLISYLMIM